MHVYTHIITLPTTLKQVLFLLDLVSTDFLVHFYLNILYYAQTEILITYFLYKIFYLFIFRERGRMGKERERNIDAREKHQLVASHMHPNWGSNLQPKHVP